MGRRILCLALALMLLSAGVGISEQKLDERTQWSLDWLKAALEGSADESAMTEAMVEAMATPGGTKAFMESLLKTTGAVLRYGEPISAEQQGMWVTLVPVTFEKMELQAILSTDAEGKLAGLLFQPVVEAAEVPLPQGARAEDVTVDAGTGYPLGGTLVIPSGEGKRPAALLVWGSGANGRDETLGANRVFAQLASGLAERGVITLRFDKRTFSHPDVMSAPDYSVEQEYVEDVLAALALLKADPRVDGVYLIGHSQGGMLAPRLAKAAGGLAGMALMAGTPRDLPDILRDQEMNMLEGTDAPDMAKMYDEWHREAKALYALDEPAAKAHEPLYGGAFGAYYLWEMHQHDNLSLIKELRIPTLILQGANDWQVFPGKDYQAFLDGLKGEDYVQFRLYEALNHAFMPSTATGLSTAFQEYNQPAQIPQEVLDDLAAFVAGA